MDKLKELLSRCKCGVFLTVNQHRNYYQSVKQKLEEIGCFGGSPPRISEEVRKKMIETDTVIEIQFYPDTPVGFYSIYHWDLDAALSEALECLKKESFLVCPKCSPEKRTPLEAEPEVSGEYPKFVYCPIHGKMRFPFKDVE